MKFFAKGTCYLDEGSGEYTILVVDEQDSKMALGGIGYGHSVQAVIYYGLCQVLEQFPSGSSIDVFTNIQMGWNNPKSKNKDIKEKLKTIAKKHNDRLTFTYLSDFSEANQLIKIYTM